MGTVAVEVVIDAPPARVWEVVEPVERHVDWMADAVAITFQGDQRRGVGTTFDTATRVGPIRLTDRMTITEWEPGRAMGVRHVGVVTGVGRFTLQETVGGATLFSWREQLHFPWWLGGPLGEGVAGRFVLARIWRRNLERLKAIAEAGPSHGAGAGPSPGG